jgi:hypothetical protein
MQRSKSQYLADADDNYISTRDYGEGIYSIREQRLAEEELNQQTEDNRHRLMTAQVGGDHTRQRIYKENIYKPSPTKKKSYK